MKIQVRLATRIKAAWYGFRLKKGEWLIAPQHVIDDRLHPVPSDGCDFEYVWDAPYGERNHGKPEVCMSRSKVKVEVTVEGNDHRHLCRRHAAMLVGKTICPTMGNYPDELPEEW